MPPPCCFSMFYQAGHVSQVVIFSSTSWNTMVYLKVKSWQFYVRWLQHWNMHMIRALHIEIWSLKMCALRSLGPWKKPRKRIWSFFFEFVRWVCSWYTVYWNLYFLMWNQQNLREVVEKTTKRWFSCDSGPADLFYLRTFLVGFGWFRLVSVGNS